MKIAHLSDTHLGYNGFGRQPMVADPCVPQIQVRQQEVDLMLGLRRAIDSIIQHKPDLVIHSGDLFDGARPSPRMVQFALTEIWRLSEAEIPMVIIEGDHSCPRAVRDGHALSLFERIPYLHVVYGPAQCVPIRDLKIHAVCHQALYQNGLPPASALTGSGGHILVTHGVADGNRLFKTGRSACNVPISECGNWYDYIALGHCHRFTQALDTDRAFYAGSTGPVVPNDFFSGSGWGFNLVDVASNPPIVERVPIETRPVHFYGLHDASGLSAIEIKTFLSRQAQEFSPRGAYCCIEIDQIDLLARRDLSAREIEEIFLGYSGFWLQMRVRQQRAASGWMDGTFEARFDQLVAESEGDADFKNEVRALGHRFLKSALLLRPDDTDDEEAEAQIES